VATLQKNLLKEKPLKQELLKSRFSGVKTMGRLDEGLSRVNLNNPAELSGGGTGATKRLALFPYLAQ
jgi:hypothetical protein